MVKREKIPKTLALIYKALYNNYSDFTIQTPQEHEGGLKYKCSSWSWHLSCYFVKYQVVNIECYWAYVIVINNALILNLKHSIFASFPVHNINSI
jgi:hypothetical protein